MRTAAASSIATSSPATSCSRSTATCASSISASRWSPTRRSRASRASPAALPTCRPSRSSRIELTNRSDLYSLGAVMYELLTGMRPFRAGNLQKLLHQIVFATPPPIHTLRPRFPRNSRTSRPWRCRRIRKSATRPGLDFAAELTRVHQKLRAAVQPHRPAGAIQPAAQAQVLPRVLARRDLGSAAREQLAGLRRRRGDRQGRRDGRSLLHHRAGPGRRRAPRQGARLSGQGRLLRRDQLRARRQAHRDHQSPRVRSPS